MLSDFVKMLGKRARELEFIKLEKLLDQIDTSFDNNDTLNKITILVNSTVWRELLHSIFPSLSYAKDKKTLLGVLGEPSYILNFPHASKKQEILFYSHDHFWLGWKFNEDVIESLSIMSPSIIPDVIKLGHIPIRLCRS